MIAIYNYKMFICILSGGQPQNVKNYEHFIAHYFEHHALFAKHSWLMLQSNSYTTGKVSFMVIQGFSAKK